MSVEPSSVYAEFGLSPVVNASGIYTDLGGSCLSPTVWRAATEANHAWVPMPQLLDRTGRAIAQMIGVEAARVVPGASAGLALAVAACMTGNDGQLMEQLPATTGQRTDLLMQSGHRYKYTRCALMSGARLVEMGGAVTTPSDIEQSLGPHVACVLHPAHLDETPGTVPLTEVTRIAHQAGVPVVVDAAYMSYPTELIAHYASAGGDLVCFSAKYFWGPNAGGFVYGRKDLIETVAALDFTGFESGPHLVFGRAFKMDRATVVATTLALREWLTMDHAGRWASYRERAENMASELQRRAEGTFQAVCFTLDERVVPEPVNSLFVTPSPSSKLTPRDLEQRLAEGDPSVRAVAVGNGVSFCLETVFEDQDAMIVDLVVQALSAPE
jgi:L-seryl-tRNA(Ser) seleniumtransferase